MKTLTKLPAMLAATVVALTGLATLQATPSQAAGRDGVCTTGEFCYYYNSGEAGSVSDFTGSLADYGTSQPSCYDFKGSGNGKGLCIKNNAASVRNNTSQTVRVFYNSNYQGHYQDFAPGTSGPLDSTLKNNNASHQFLPGTPSTPPATGCKGIQGQYYAPVQTGTKFSAASGEVGSDGKYYVGQHDIPVPLGTPVYAIADGTVTYQQAYTVIGGVKKLTSYGNNIRFSGAGVTAVYAHLNSFQNVALVIPSSQTYRQSGSSGSLTLKSVTVKKCDLIGFSGTTGNSTGPHLHFELYINKVRVNPPAYLGMS